MLAKMRALGPREVQLSHLGQLNLEDWLDTWLTTVMPRKVEPGTLDTYLRWSSPALTRRASSDSQP
jgi:hypothetical protein